MTVVKRGAGTIPGGGVVSYDRTTGRRWRDRGGEGQTSKRMEDLHGRKGLRDARKVVDDDGHQRRALVGQHGCYPAEDGRPGDG